MFQWCLVSQLLFIYHLWVCTLVIMCCLCIMCHPLQLSLFVHVLLSRSFLFQLHHAFVYKSVFSFLVVLCWFMYWTNYVLFQNTISSTVTTWTVQVLPLFSLESLETRLSYTLCWNFCLYPTIGYSNITVCVLTCNPGYRPWLIYTQLAWNPLFWSFKNSKSSYTLVIDLLQIHWYNAHVIAGVQANSLCIVFSDKWHGIKNCTPLE